jgi:hypothetical protein
MPEEWYIFYVAEQVEGIVHTSRKVSTGSEKKFRYERQGDRGYEGSEASQGNLKNI